MTAITKFTYIRSEKLMAMYRTIPCQHCGIDDGTVSGAHSNSQKHGKGRGIKASDEFCASLCAACHFWLDFGQALRAIKTAAWQLAYEKTVIVMTRVHGNKYLSLVNRMELAA